MHIRLSYLAKCFLYRAVPMFRCGRGAVLFLILLLFAAVPVFAQDADEDEEIAAEETAEEEIAAEEISAEEISAETEAEEASEPSASAGTGSAAASAASAQPSKNAATGQHNRGVLMLLPFTASYAEYVFVTNTVSKHVASLDGPYIVMQKELD